MEQQKEEMRTRFVNFENAETRAGLWLNPIRLLNIS